MPTKTRSGGNANALQKPLHPSEELAAVVGSGQSNGPRNRHWATGILEGPEREDGRHRRARTGLNLPTSRGSTLA
jgi:hypothetical protein